MIRPREILQLGVLVFLAAVCVFAAYEMIYPPFSDEEIQASFVDTWGANAQGTVVISLFVFLAITVSAALGWRSSPFAKRLALVSVTFGSAGIALLISSHISLTERTIALTGRSFGGFYGLL